MEILLCEPSRILERENNMLKEICSEKEMLWYWRQAAQQELKQTKTTFVCAILLWWQLCGGHLAVREQFKRRIWQHVASSYHNKGRKWDLALFFPMKFILIVSVFYVECIYLVHVCSGIGRYFCSSMH